MHELLTAQEAVGKKVSREICISNGDETVFIEAAVSQKEAHPDPEIRQLGIALASLLRGRVVITEIETASYEFDPSEME